MTRVEERIIRVPDQHAPRSATEWRELLRKLDWAMSSKRFDDADLDVLELAIVQAYRSLHARREQLAKGRPRRPT